MTYNLKRDIKELKDNIRLEFLEWYPIAKETFFIQTYLARIPTSGRMLKFPHRAVKHGDQVSIIDVSRQVLIRAQCHQ